MQATLTQLRRQTATVLRPVLAGRTVRVTDHDSPVAIVRPDYPVRTMTVDEFRALPLTDAELDAAVNRTLQDLRHEELP